MGSPASRDQLTLRSLGDPAENLERFLKDRDKTTGDLAAEVCGLFGQPVCAVASGSVVVGYGNPTSDIDVYTVVPAEHYEQVPVATSYAVGVLSDLFFYEDGALSSELRALAKPGFLEGPADEVRSRWNAAHRALDLAIRFAYGVELVGSDEWRAIRTSLRDQWLRDWAVRWWRLDAWRHVVAARWLLPASRRQAAQHLFHALLFGLKAVASAAGFVYFQPKWVPLELEAMEREDLADVLRSGFRIAESEDVLSSADQVEEILRSLVGPPSTLLIELAYAPGVELYRLAESTLVMRWESRALRVAAPLPAETGGGALWRGTFTDLPPEDLLELFRHGMLWMGAAHAGD